MRKTDGAVILVGLMKLGVQYTQDVDDPPEEEYHYIHIGEPEVAVSSSFVGTNAYSGPAWVVGQDGRVRWLRRSS